MRNFLKALIILLALSEGSYAQTDAHFSQYYSYPMFLNPGLTGAIDGDYRVTAIYRSQWNKIDNGFSTAGVSGELTTNKNVNLGINILNQSTGGGGYNNLNGYLSMSYTGVRFGRDGNQHISMGLSAGVINRHFDPSKFKAGNQWGAGGYDPNVPVADILDKTSSTSLDAGAGIMYFDGTPGKKANIFAGFSAFHLTRPTDPFITSGKDEKMPVRYTAHGGVKLSLSERFSITPNLLYMRQGKSDEKMAGAYAQMQVNESTDFLIGANYRVKDAISPYVGFYYNNLVLGVSYDINNSDLGKAAGNANAFEISLSFTGRKAHKTSALPFICPRL